MAPPSPPPYHGTDPPPPAYAHRQSHFHPPPPSYHVDTSAPRHPKMHWYTSIIRPWAIVVPAVTLVMNVWWFGSGRLCEESGSVVDECFWVLWLSLPIAFVSMVWNLATLISSRRINAYRRGISTSIQLPVQVIVASGAVTCLGLMSWHYATYYIWMRHLEGVLIALVAIISLSNLLLVGFVAHEWLQDRRYRQNFEMDVIR